MSNITKEEIEALEATKCESDWNRVCDQIKKAHGGYPDDWWDEVKLTGRMDRIMGSWVKPQSSELRVVSFSR